MCVNSLFFDSRSYQRGRQRLLLIRETTTLHAIHRYALFLSDISFAERNWLEPLESELAVQVEYDMDEQGVHPRVGVVYVPISQIDQEWLDALNSERKKEQLDRISYEAFEIVMDRLEKEWFDLVCDDVSSISALIHVGYRRRTYRNPTWHCHLKTQLVQFAMIQRERIPTLSFSAMDVI
jgi:hypothetical protein